MSDLWLRLLVLLHCQSLFTGRGTDRGFQYAKKRNIKKTFKIPADFIRYYPASIDLHAEVPTPWHGGVGGGDAMVYRVGGGGCRPTGYFG